MLAEAQFKAINFKAPGSRRLSRKYSRKTLVNLVRMYPVVVQYLLVCETKDRSCSEARFAAEKAKALQRRPYVFFFDGQRGTRVESRKVKIAFARWQAETKAFQAKKIEDAYESCTRESNLFFA